MKQQNYKKLLFVTNYFNHHQRPLADAMFAIYGESYAFVETREMDEERKVLGWREEDYPEYVVTSNEFHQHEKKFFSIISSADVVIIGSASKKLVKERIKNNKLTFFYSERILKHNNAKWKYPFRLFTWRMKFPQKKNVNILCASAYTSADFAKFGLYKEQCYKWGYFTEVKLYEDMDVVLSSKKGNSILWVGRLIEWKHPEVPILLARKLKEEGYNFELNIVGSGPLEKRLKEQICSEDLYSYVHLVGPMKPKDVREYMERSEIFLFTSDRNEGWGAVLNESLNSGCAVVASHAIGAVPYLLSNGENGLIYVDGDEDELYKKVKWLLDHRYERTQIAKKAYYTMTNEWNPENAAKKFANLMEQLLDGNEGENLYNEGICSKADTIKDNWFI